MIRWLVMLLARVLLEVAVTALLIGVLTAVLAYRVSRRLLTPSPDRLEKLSGQAVGLAAILQPLASTIRQAGVNSTEPYEEDPE